MKAIPSAVQVSLFIYIKNQVMSLQGSLLRGGVCGSFTCGRFIAPKTAEGGAKKITAAFYEFIKDKDLLDLFAIEKFLG